MFNSSARIDPHIVASFWLWSNYDCGLPFLSHQAFHTDIKANLSLCEWLSWLNMTSQNCQSFEFWSDFRLPSHRCCGLSILSTALVTPLQCTGCIDLIPWLTCVWLFYNFPVYVLSGVVLFLFHMYVDGHILPPFNTLNDFRRWLNIFPGRCHQRGR